MSEFETASMLSFVTKTFSISLYSSIVDILFLVRYKDVILSLISRPFAILKPKLPTPIIAIFILIYY